MAVKWRVDELVARKGWTPRQLAEHAGVDVKTARNILKGRATRVDLETIGRLADALGVAPGALWRRTETHRSSARWQATAGSTGRAGPKEVNAVLVGVEDESTNPALERATR
jgi:DNA-binding Xre family transcriptional regulator